MTTRALVAVTGASGFLGRAICQRLTESGHEIVRIGRAGPHSRADVVWDPAAGTLDATALEGVQAIVHLSGENIAQRWTADRKREIVDSRVQGTTLIARTAASLREKPRLLVSASAIGFYGNRGDELLDETATRGSGFLAGVVERWERSADPARQAGIRVVHPRFGLVLNPAGGVLERLLPIFRIGAGGRIGSGEQWMSWIALDDLTRAVDFLIRDGDTSGVVNVVAPGAVSNAAFSEVLAGVLHRPAVALVPAFAVRLMFGEMGEETVLSGQHVVPARLERAGFTFDHPTLAGALRHELAEPDR